MKSTKSSKVDTKKLSSAGLTLAKIFGPKLKGKLIIRYRDEGLKQLFGKEPWPPVF